MTLLFGGVVLALICIYIGTRDPETQRFLAIMTAVAVGAVILGGLLP